MSSLQDLLRRLSIFLFGFEYFISFTRRDGENYARALAQRLEERGYICFLDSGQMKPGHHWKRKVSRALRRAKYLVVVATPGAMTSPQVVYEVTEFQEHKAPKERLIPIYFQTSRADAAVPLLACIAPDAIFLEDPCPSPFQEPATAVVDGLNAANNFTRNQFKLQIFLVGMVLAMVVLTAASVIGYVMAEQRRLAVEQGKRWSEALRLAAESKNEVHVHPQRAALLAAESVTATEQDGVVSSRSDEALRRALAACRGIPVMAHDHDVVDLAPHPSQPLLASCGWDGTVNLWTMSSNHLVHSRTLAKFDNRVTRAIWSPDGKCLWTVGWTGFLSQWVLDKEGRFERKDTLVNDRGIDLLEADPSGRWLFLANTEHTSGPKHPWLWEVQKGTFQVFPGLDDGVAAARFVDSSKLAISDFEGGLRIYDLETMTTPVNIRLPFAATSMACQAGGYWLAFTDVSGRVAVLNWRIPDAEVLEVQVVDTATPGQCFITIVQDRYLIAADSRAVRVWDLQDLKYSKAPMAMAAAKPGLQLRGPAVAVSSSSSDVFLATGDWDNGIQTFQFIVGKRTLIAGQRLSGHDDWIASASFDRNGRLITGSGDGQIRFWNIDGNHAGFTGERYRWHKHREYVDRVVVEPSAMCSISQDGTLHVARLNPDDPWTAPESLGLYSLEQPIYALSRRADGVLACGGGGGNVWLQSDPMCRPILIATLPSPVSELFWVKENLVCMDQSGTVWLWNKQNLKPLRLPGPVPVTSIRPAFEGFFLGREDGTVEEWAAEKVRAGTPTSSWQAYEGQGVSALSLVSTQDEGGLLITAGANDNRLIRWRRWKGGWLATGERAHDTALDILQTSPDGLWLVWGSSLDDSVQICAGGDFSKSQILRGHAESVSAVAFSPGNDLLATADSGGTCQLWKLGTSGLWEPWTQIPGTVQVSTLAFSSCGAWLAAGLGDGEVFLIPLRAGQLLERCRDVVGRNFTRFEWERYFGTQPYRKTFEGLPSGPLGVHSLR